MKRRGWPRPERFSTNPGAGDETLITAAIFSPGENEALGMLESAVRLNNAAALWWR
jgi:hypothetical protein